MNSKANEISPGQLFIFVVSGQIGFGILSMASLLAEKVGHDGWIAVSIGGLVASISIVLIIGTLKRFDNKNILDINKFIFGKYVGTILNILILAYPTYTSVIMIRMFNDIIRMSVLRLTPPLVITTFIFLPIVYLSWYGLKYVCRYSTLKVVLVISVVAYYMLLMKYFRSTFLRPIGASGFVELFKASFSPYTSFIGYELLTFIYPFIKDKKKVLKSTLFANTFTVTFYLITVIFITGFFGETMLKQLIFPVFSLARAYRAPVFERLDLFFISLWFPIMVSTVMAYYFCGYNGLKIFLNIENSKPKCKILILCYTTTIILLSRLPKDMIQLSTLFDQLGYIATGYVGYILIIYLLSFLKRGKENNEKATQSD